MKKSKDKKRTEPRAKKQKKIALGRGLDALIPDFRGVEDEPKTYFQCDIDRIRPNRFQPRLRFSQDDLEGLAQSITEQGIIQPLLVRKDGIDYELITGERRLRAAKLAGLSQVPVIVRAITDGDLLEMSIVENIQREDLNPMEEAEAYHQLMTTFDLTQDQVAMRVGKSRSAVTNFLRLRKLPEQLKASIRNGELSMGHARALLGAETSAQQTAAWRSVVAKGLNVRQTENLIKRLKAEQQKPTIPPGSSEERHLLSLAEDLSRRFGTKVQIKRRGQQGRVEIKFYSYEDLDRLLSLLRQI